MSKNIDNKVFDEWINFSDDYDFNRNVFDEWVNHSDASYHHFTPNEAKAIRQSLLVWYRENRRKLPWRGDPLNECKGSTAGINNPKKKPSKVSGQGRQSSIKTFFKTNIEPPPPDESRPDMVQSKDDEQGGGSIKVSAYGVWVSEIMLQQTRVEAVIPYWIKWMNSFPTVQDLADATEEEVNSHWAGLGFYRRGRLLHQGAKYVVNELNGEIPETVDGLLELPGIGRYTASAIASIAFNKPVAVVDGNVCRVLSRLTGIANNIKAPILKDKLGWDLATQLIMADQDGAFAGEVNQALMELGATYCAPSGSGIDPRDPLRKHYKSTQLGRAYRSMMGKDPTFQKGLTRIQPSAGCALCGPEGVKTALATFQDNMKIQTLSEDTCKGDARLILDSAANLAHGIFPLDPPKTKKREEDLAVAVVTNTYQKETVWLMVKRPSTGLLAGQWEFPSVCVQTRNGKKSKDPAAESLQKDLNEYLQKELGEWIAEINHTPVKPAPLEHIFSHVKHIMWISSGKTEVEIDTLRWTTSSGRDFRWMREKDMKDVGITSGVKKVLKVVKGDTGKAKKRKRES